MASPQIRKMNANLQKSSYNTKHAHQAQLPRGVLGCLDLPPPPSSPLPAGWQQQRHQSPPQTQRGRSLHTVEVHGGEGKCWQACKSQCLNGSLKHGAHHPLQSYCQVMNTKNLDENRAAGANATHQQAGVHQSHQTALHTTKCRQIENYAHTGRGYGPGAPIAHKADI